MDADTVFVWVALISFVVNAIQLWRLRKRNFALWLVLWSLVIAGLAIGQIPYRGAVAGTLWAAYILIGQIVGQMELRGWMRRDWRMVRLAGLYRSVLYPGRTSRDMLRFIAAMRRLEQDPDAGMPDQSGMLDREKQDMLRAWQLMLRGDFAGVVAWTDTIGDKPQWLWMVRQRALMELDRAEQLAQEFNTRNIHDFSPQDLAMVRLGFMAWAGQEAALNVLLNGPLRHQHPSEKALWRLRCQIAEGRQPETIPAALDGLAAQPAPELVRRAITRERGRFPWHPDLSAVSVQTLIQHWQSQLAQSRRLARPWLSIVLIIMNMIMFALTSDGHGDVSVERAIQSGLAIYPDMAQNGEWWRLLTANFLHANWIHLGMNMLGIAIIGMDLERNLGVLRYAVIYFLSGIGTMAAGILIYCLIGDFTEPYMALGASGAIFGLLGSFAVLAWHRMRHHNARKGKQALCAVALMLILQTCFDLSYLHGSSTLHLAGFMTGIIISLCILPHRFRQQLFTDH